MGEQFSSRTTKIICIVVGIAGLLCFFLTFAKVSFLGFSDSFSGFGLFNEILSEQGKIDQEEKDIILWMIVSFAGGLVGVISSFVINGLLIGGISDVLGAVFLFLLKDAIEGYGFETGTGWTLAIICFALAAVCAFFTVHLEKTEVAETKTPEESKMYDPSKNMDIIKLRDELAKFRVDENEKK